MLTLSQPSDNISSADTYITDININVGKNKMPTQTCLEFFSIFLVSFNIFIFKVYLFHVSWLKSSFQKYWACEIIDTKYESFLEKLGLKQEIKL